MKLSVSNIAWDLSEDSEVAVILAAANVQTIEIAPTKVWAAPLGLTSEVISNYREFWESRAIQIVAFQSLLFGKPELEIFGTAESRHQTFLYLAQIIELAASLGARVLVFGSPKNRLAGHLKPNEALDIAISFFADLAEVAAQHKVCFCIEPNPPQYGCDFVCTSAEGLDLVKRVNHPGFRLHLDAGAITLNNEAIEASLESCFEYLAHFHISEPGLTSIGQGGADHPRISRALRQLGYNKFVSIEMLNKTTLSNPVNVKAAIHYAAEIYL